jgi:hypothetical protein
MKAGKTWGKYGSTMAAANVPCGSHKLNETPTHVKMISPISVYETVLMIEFSISRILGSSTTAAMDIINIINDTSIRNNSGKSERTCITPPMIY